MIIHTPYGAAMPNVFDTKMFYTVKKNKNVQMSVYVICVKKKKPYICDI